MIRRHLSLILMGIVSLLFLVRCHSVLEEVAPDTKQATKSAKEITNKTKG